jgi:hypothetical protein
MYNLMYEWEGRLTKEEVEKFEGKGFQWEKNI